MISTVSRLFILSIFTFLVAACNTKAVVVDSPVDGSLYSTPPDIQLTFADGLPDIFQVTLNNQDITSQLTVTEAGATAPGTAIEDYLVDGENFLKVTKPNVVMVAFIYDISGPEVHVTEVIDGASLTVSGYIEDPSDVVLASLNGNALVLAEDNTFTATVPAADYMTFETEDTLGLQRSQVYADGSVTIDDSMAIEIGSEGLEVLINQIEDVLEASSLAPLLESLNPVESMSVLILSAEANVNDVMIGAADLDLIPSGSNGNLSLSGSMADLWLAFDVETAENLLLTTLRQTFPGEATADQVTFTGDINVSANNGVVDVSLENLVVDASGLSLIKVAGIPTWFLDPLLVALDGVVEAILVAELERIIPEKVAPFLTPYTDGMVFDVFGAQITPAIMPMSIGTAGDNIQILLNSNIYAVTDHGPKSIGSRFVEVDVLPEPLLEAPSGQIKTVGLVVSENTLNQAMSALTEAGALNLTVGTTIAPELQGVDLFAKDVRARIVPSSAPHIDLVNGLEDSIGLVTVQDLYVAIESYTDANGWELVVGATVDVVANAGLSISDDNALVVDAVNLASLKLRDIDDAGMIHTEVSLVKPYFDELMPGLIHISLRSVAAIPLPTFAGLGIGAGEMWVADPNGEYVNVAGNLISIGEPELPLP